MSETYQSVRDNFVWNRPDHFNFAHDVIDQWAQRSADQLAMLWVDDAGGEARYSFSDISQASRRVANMLTNAGVEKGDRVIVILGREVAWWEILTACLRMGAVASPGTRQLSAKDIAYRINAAQATCVITDASNADKIDEVASDCKTLKVKVQVGGPRDGWIDYTCSKDAASDDFATVNTRATEDALCYFTSGTTGYPKMCIHNHLYGLSHRTTGQYWLDLKEQDLHWNLSDTGWAKAAWSSYFGPWNCGAAIFVHCAAGFDPVRSLELLAQYPITTFCGAPTIYRMFVLQDLSQYDFAPLRHCVGAGEPLNPEVIEVWRRATGLIIRDGYGQTETGILCGSFPSIEPRFGSMGKPAPGVDLAVIDDTGIIQPVDIEGDIAVRVKPEVPVGLFKEYKNQPEKTAESFRGDWYVTGDRGKVDKDGYFWFISRADDVILSAGYRIGPFEVESALIEHPAVAESAVVSSPDPRRGEVVKAFVVLAPGYQGSDSLAEELQQYVKRVTAPYKYPRKIEFLEDLPKTVSGKIRRIELRDREWGRS